MSDPRTFHAMQFFAGVSDDSIKAMALDGGYMALAAKYQKLHAQNEHLRAELARINDKAQRTLQRLPA